MMKTTRKACHLFLLSTLCMAVSAPVLSERLYKWVDANGVVQYTSQLPPEASQQERKEINEHGRVMKVYSAPKTEEEKAEAKRLADLAAKKKVLDEKRAIHDRSLLSTYSSRQDMLDAQQGKISMVESLLQLTRSRTKSMQDRLVALTEEAAGYERSGKELPAPLKQQIQNLRDQIAQNTRFEQGKEAEIVLIRQQFEKDIARYDELTMGKKEEKKPRKTPLEIAMNNPALKLDDNDRALLGTFSSEEDLLSTREEELKALDTEIDKASEMVDKLQQRQAELTVNSNEYTTRGETPPQPLVSKIEGMTTDIRQGESLLREKRKQREIVEQRYSEDLERYRELTASNNQPTQAGLRQ